MRWALWTRRSRMPSGAGPHIRAATVILGGSGCLRGVSAACSSPEMEPSLALYVVRVGYRTVAATLMEARVPYQGVAPCPRPCSNIRRLGVRSVPFGAIGFSAGRPLCGGDRFWLRARSVAVQDIPQPVRMG